MTWTIRTKFLAVMATLLATCLGVYLFLAITVFKTDKTQLVYDLNKSQVSTLINELETQFSGVSEKLKVFALLPPVIQSKMAGDLLSEDSDVVAVMLFKLGQAEPDRVFYQEKFLETYGLEKPQFSKTHTADDRRLKAIAQNGEDLWNASSPEGPPLIAYGRLVVLEDESGAPLQQWAVVGLIRLDRFLKSVSVSQLSEVAVFNRSRELLIHPRAEWLLARPELKDDPLVEEALNLKARVSVVNRDDGEDRVLAALAKGFNNQIYVLSRVSERRAFQVVRDLSVRTLLFGTIVLTLVILAAFLLSRPLTRNIAALAERMESVAKGDLSTPIALRGRDETVSLGQSFNEMISELQESRDALEAMNRDLDLKVKERTRQLEEQNRKIKEVQEALIRTTRLASVGELAGRAAHEVLNPLTILLTRAGLVQKKIAGDEETSILGEIRKAWTEEFNDGGFDRLLASWRSPSKVFAGKSLFEEDLENVGRAAAHFEELKKALAADIRFITDEGERIAKIVSGMRRLGHLQSNAQPHSVRALLTDCGHIMGDLFEQRRFKIRTEFRDGPDTCVFDRDEMIQAVTNLMRNSLQALELAGPDQPEPTLVMRTTSDGNQIYIDIEDNGIGIAADDQGRLFESRFTTKSAEEGTGLGLGIARRFVREFGGDIEFVGSESKVKTVFRIRLPQAPQDSKISRGAAA